MLCFVGFVGDPIPFFSPLPCHLCSFVPQSVLIISASYSADGPDRRTSEKPWQIDDTKMLVLWARHFDFQYVVGERFLFGASNLSWLWNSHTFRGLFCFNPLLLVKEKIIPLTVTSKRIANRNGQVLRYQIWQILPA